MAGGDSGAPGGSRAKLSDGLPVWGMRPRDGLGWPGAAISGDESVRRCLLGAEIYILESYINILFHWTLASTEAK